MSDQPPQQPTDEDVLLGALEPVVPPPDPRLPAAVLLGLTAGYDLTDPHAGNWPDIDAWVDAHGAVRNVWHVGPSLGRPHVTLGAQPPLILDRPQAIALVVWLSIAVGLSGDELLDLVSRARSSLAG